MKKILFLAFLFPSLMIAQIQVSEIEYQLPRDNYSKKGFMKIGDDEYFIEQGKEGTKVSLVENNNLEFIHELKHRPTDSKLNTYTSSYDKSNSGLIYEGALLYELYWDYIYIVNVLTGELKEIINLQVYDIRLQKEFYFGESFFHFKALGEGWNGYVRLDRNTGALENLLDNGIVVKSKRYWFNIDSTKLNYYDLETNQILEHPNQFSKIEFITKHESDLNTQLIIKDEFGIHLLRNNNTIETLNCIIPDGSHLRYVFDNRIVYTTDTGSEIVLSINELENCTEIFSTSFLYTSTSPTLSFHSDEQLFGEYFIFGFPNDWEGNGQFYLYDITLNNTALIDIPIDIPFLNKSARYGNSLYFLTTNHVHLIGSLPELYRLDLDNYQSERISEQNIFETWNIVMGEVQNDMELNVYYTREETASLLQINDQQQSLEQIEEFNLLENFGIYPNIYNNLWAENKYFFSTTDAIYVMENDVTTKLISNTYGSSSFKRNGDYVHVLAGLDSAYFALKINISDLSYNSTLLPDVAYQFYGSANSENAIVNLHHSLLNPSSSGFFDIDSEAFISLGELGLPTGTPEYLSGNNILFKASSSEGYKWYLINTLSREVVLTEIEIGTFPDPYPDGKGGFYLDGWAYGDNVSFMYLDSQGKITHIYEDFNFKVFLNGDKFDGHVKSLAFDAPNELIIISTKDGDVKKKVIPVEGLNYNYNLFWHESDEMSFISFYNGTNHDTYIFNFETDPENITPEGRNERLFMVLEEESYAILVYQNNEQVLTFERYDFTSGTLEPLSEFSFIPDSYKFGNPYKIGDYKYMVSLNDGIHGLEPWICNTITGELQLLKDFNAGLDYSRINNFTVNPISKEIYFSAIKTEKDRQLFRLNLDLNHNQELNKPIVTTLNIFPIPSSQHIILDENFKHVIIMSIDGKIITSLMSYRKGFPISIAELKEGIYLIQARLNNDQLEVGKFIINRS